MTAEPYGREGLPLAQARDAILTALQPLGRNEVLPLMQALGRTTASAVQAPNAVPGFRASIMDGYAIAGAEQPEPGARWRLVGASAAGAPYGTALHAGEAVRILTGAVVPEGSKRVLPQELVAAAGDQLELLKPCGTNPWIRPPEEEAAPGQILVPSGWRLGVADLGRLASCGMQKLELTGRARLGLLISGDELVPPGHQRGAGQIWESNSTLLSALLQRLGYPVTKQLVVADAPEPLREALLDPAPRGRAGGGGLLEAVPQTRTPLCLGAGGGGAFLRTAGQSGGGSDHGAAAAVAGAATPGRG
jgi:molybdopterin molybdotransferase